MTAQQSLEWEELLDELYAASEEHTVTREENLETLADLAAHPFNLNTATREDLERIPSCRPTSTSITVCRAWASWP